MSASMTDFPGLPPKHQKHQQKYCTPITYGHNTMEGLLAEINKKKTEDFASSSSGNKYLKRGDLERQKEEEAARRRDEERKRKAQDDDAESDEKRARKQRKEVGGRDGLGADSRRKQLG